VEEAAVPTQEQMEERLEAIAAAQLAARREAAPTELRSLGVWLQRPEASPLCCYGCLATQPDRLYWHGPPARVAGPGVTMAMAPASLPPQWREAAERGLVTPDDFRANGAGLAGPRQVIFCERCVAEMSRAPGSPLPTVERVAELEQEAERLQQELEAQPPERGSMSSKRRPR
jgi:hypothetical protein